MIGFETIGNATAICIDDRPVLVTDPWIAGDAYFGSWSPSHHVPAEQREHVLACQYVWLSHGHPDHVNGASLDLLRAKTILLPDHIGGRMRDDLTELGFAVRVLPDRVWTRLSPHLRVLCIADYNQDAILLMDVGGRLLVDVNDAVERGWGGFVKRIISQYETSFLLKLFGYGDADMIHVFDEEGRSRTPPPPTASDEAKRSWDALFADKVGFWARYFGTRYLIPFSMFHAYQRLDSAWANAYTTPPSAFDGVHVRGCEILPAFVRFDCERDELVPIRPPARAIASRSPREFGDDWAEPLEASDVVRLERYIRGNELLRGHLEAVTFRVGGREHSIDVDPSRRSRSRFGRSRRAITFEVPRGSLMQAVENEVFDDLLIGNFMRTTIHGDWGPAPAPNVLYPHFTPFVARYADNARVKTRAALEAYFREYRRRAPIEHLLHRIEFEGVQKLRAFIDPSSRIFRVATRAYSHLKSTGAAGTR
jgi:hypothetical protein